jgi:hypothetical protein
MANLSDVLKNLIRRGQKEIREDTSTTRKAILQYRARYRHAQAATRSQAKVIAFEIPGRTTAGTNGQPRGALGRIAVFGSVGLKRCLADAQAIRQTHQ